MGGFSKGTTRRVSSRGTGVLALVRVVALVASVTLVVAACGDDGDDSDDASDDATEEPAPDDDSGGDVDVQGLDYTGALFTVEDFDGIVPGDYVAADEASTAGSRLRGLCGEGQVGPEAVAGELLELQDAEPTISFTTSVDGFASEEDAADAFARARDIAEPCESYVSQGDPFERTSPLVTDEYGDESFNLFAHKTDTGLYVGDYFARQGQFVFDVRIAAGASSPYSEAVLAGPVEAAVQKFLDWVEAETG